MDSDFTSVLTIPWFLTVLHGNSASKDFSNADKSMNREEQEKVIYETKNKNGIFPRLIWQYDF